MKCIKSNKPEKDAIYLYMIKKEAEGKAKKSSQDCCIQ